MRTTPINPALGLLLSVVLAMPSAAAPPDLSQHAWSLVSPATAAPPARRDAAMVYDRARQRLIVFGGRRGGTSLADTWSFDLGTRAWVELAVAPATRPPDRFSVVAGVDATRDRMIITTGEDDAGTFFDDAWAFDLTNDRWTPITTSGGPPARRYGSAGGVFDLAATSGPALYLSHGFTFSGRFDDAWALDLASDTWTQVPAPAPLPLKRCLHTATMLSPSSLILFGGCASGFGPCPLDDLWRLDAAVPSWTQVSITGPSARTHPVMVAIGASESALLFGGSASGNQDDLWLLDAQTLSWQRLTPAGATPPARNGHAAVWVDSPMADACGQFLIFGGAGNSGELSDVWSFANTSPPAPDPVLHARATPTGIELQWATTLSLPAWEVWRAARPDFNPGDADATLLATPIAITGGTASIRDEPLAPGDYFWKARGVGCQ